MFSGRLSNEKEYKQILNENRQHMKMAAFWLLLKSHNHRMAQIGRNFKDHLLRTTCHEQGHHSSTSRPCPTWSWSEVELSTHYGTQLFCTAAKRVHFRMQTRAWEYKPIKLYFVSLPFTSGKPLSGTMLTSLLVYTLTREKAFPNLIFQLWKHATVTQNLSSSCLCNTQVAKRVL